MMQRRALLLYTAAAAHSVHTHTHPSYAQSRECARTISAQRKRLHAFVASCVLTLQQLHATLLYFGACWVPEHAEFKQSRCACARPPPAAEEVDSQLDLDGSVCVVHVIIAIR